VGGTAYGTRQSSAIPCPGRENSLRLEIASSHCPRFDRNLNTGEDQATGTRWQTAAQTIFHAPRYPSHILLPVIPR
jgi:predicted acyl esterase